MNEQEQRARKTRALCHTAAEPDREGAGLSDSAAHLRGLQTSIQIRPLRKEKADGSQCTMNRREKHKEEALYARQNKRSPYAVFDVVIKQISDLYLLAVCFEPQEQQVPLH